MSADAKRPTDRIEWESQTPDGNVLLSPSWEVFVLGTSIISVFNLFFLLIIRNPDLDQVIVSMDILITIVFLADFVRRLVIADDYRVYFTRGKGWIDFLSIFPVLRLFRLLRMIRILRVMRRLGGPEGSLRAIFSDKAAGGLLSVLLVAILVMEFGSLLILAIERGQPGANIETAGDALWYVLVTMSTVGYGDQFPVTDSGRIAGAAIIIVGIGVFGTLTGFLANLFLSPSRPRAAESVPLADLEASGKSAAGVSTD